MGSEGRTKEIIIEPGRREDYERLKVFHYRGDSPGAWAAMFRMVDARARGGIEDGLAGVIMYTMPAAGLEMRKAALGGFLSGLGRSDLLRVLNENVRCISRVIIEPRYRGLGLAARLVRETMGLVGVRVIEAMAVMGQVNPFFEKAGMKAFYGGRQARCEEMVGALGMAGIEEDELVDSGAVVARIGGLEDGMRRWLMGKMERFLEAYGAAGKARTGGERIEYVLSKLGDRPVYYVKVLHSQSK